MMLDALTAAVLQVKPWSPARRLVVRNHLTQFARMLGCDSPAACPPERYNVSDDEVFRLVTRHKPDVTSATQKNIRMNIQNVLREGRRRQWIPAIENRHTITPWRQGSLHGERVHRGTGADRRRYALKPLPPDLRQEMEAYLAWCELPIAEDRHYRIKKRPVSSHIARGVIARLAGYKVSVEGLDGMTPAEHAALLTLEDLYDPAFLKRFAWWWLTRRGKPTSGVKDILGTMLTIAHYWPPERRRQAGMSEAQRDAERVKDLVVVERIRKIFANLPPNEAVLDKERQWLSLEELDTIGQHAHPLNKDRLKESRFAREVARHVQDPRRYLRPGASLTWLAAHVGLALMLRLWVHRPIRSRTMRDIRIRPATVTDASGQTKRLDANLIAEPPRGYLLRFVGENDLKTGRRQGQLNRWEEHFPYALLPALDDWLHVWRPRLTAPDCPWLFVTKGGRRWTDNNLTQAISKLTWGFTQQRPGGPVATTPHMIRTIFRTEMCKAGLDLLTCARLLGDSVAVVHKHYSHVTHRAPISQWTRDLARAIAEGTD